MIKLFVGGFPLDMTELELVQLIAPHATVITIKIVRDKKTKLCKGFAFLEMADLEESKRAVEALDGTPMGKRALSLNVTVERDAPPKVAAPPQKPSYQSNYQPSYNKVSRQPEGDLKKKRPRRSM